MRVEVYGCPQGNAKIVILIIWTLRIPCSVEYKKGGEYALCMTRSRGTKSAMLFGSSSEVFGNRRVNFGFF